MKKRNCILIISILIFSCNNKDDYIQDVYVNEIIPLSLPEYSDVLIPGNSIFVTGGVEGIIIYHGVGDDYKVYDRNCSYEPSLACSYIDSVNSGIAYCGCCPSVFDINNSGEPINAPALLPLKQYNWSLDNNNILRIFN
jgi:Rieske Fe-S protein